MTFVLHRAERADVLCRALGDLLAEPVADPFAEEIVAVHSRGVERWLSHQLAARLGASEGRTDGVCANLAFPFPGRLVQQIVAEVTGIDPATDPWRPERLAWPLLDVVDANLSEPWLYVLAGHIGASATGGDDTNRDRRFATVRHLADLFDRYAVHRPQMLLAWAAGHDTDGGDADGVTRQLPDDVRWQAELWRRLRTALGRPSPAERTKDGCGALLADPALAQLPERLSLFGLTRLPVSYFDVLRAVAEHRDVHLFALHPSPAAWGVDDATQLHHPLLRAWGRDSHEMQVVLRERLAGDTGSIDHHHGRPSPAGDTLLHRVQAAIRDDLAPDGARATPHDERDTSLQVHACHGRTRQAEVVRDAITHLFADDPTLEPRDVVILCPDIDEMAPLLRAAFDDAADGNRTIPYRLADRSLRQTNPVLGATAELLALVDARLTASQVLGFAALVPVRQRFGFDDDDLERIGEWIRTMGTRWGLDADHRAPYDLAAVEAGTWEAGIRRLLLGVAMTEDDQRLVGGTLPLDDVDSGDIDLAGRLAEMVGRLGDTVRSLTDPRPVIAWTEAINHAADLLLDTRAVDAWQRSQLDRLLVDVVEETNGGQAATTPLRLAEIRDLLADRLKGQPSRAAFRTGDLTMCSLVPMRSVPHRVVCLVGLDDGAFPRGGAPDGDDLLLRAHHLGDHDRRAEDRQLLLDAVLAAGDALVITYAGRDARTNEVLPPAVPVNELLDVVDATITAPTGGLGRGGLGRGDLGRGDLGRGDLGRGDLGRDAIVRHHPLQPSDARCFEPGALRPDGPWGFDPELLLGAKAAAEPRTTPGPFLEQRLDPAIEPVVALDDLVAFVHHPVRAFLRQRLGLSLRRWDDRPDDGMVIELDNLERWAVGDRLLNAFLAGDDPDAVCAAELARGLLPPGTLGRDVLADARADAETLFAAATAQANGPRESLEVDIALQVDIALDGGRAVVGSVPDVIGSVIRSTTFSRLGPKQRLRAWVHLLAASASHPSRALTSATVGKNRRSAATFHLPAIPAAEARALLADLVALRDDALREPLPLYCATSYAYAQAVDSGDRDPIGKAGKEWTSEFSRPREDNDEEHLLVLGGQRSIDDVAADPRFGDLARRLWQPIFDAARQASR